MKKLALFLVLIFILAVSCEKNESEYTILTEYKYINSMTRIGDTLLVISSQPSDFSPPFPTAPPYQISKISLLKNKVLFSKEIPPSILAKVGQPYLATVDRKILKLNSDLSFEQLCSIPSYVRSLVCDENKNVWIATNEDGLYLYDGNDTSKFDNSNSILTSNWVPSITLDSKSNVWFVQGMDLFKIDINKNISKDPYQLPLDRPTGVFDLSVDKENTLFCSKGDQGHNILFKKETNSPWTVIDPPESSNNRSIKFIKSDMSGTIWICYSNYPKDLVAFFDDNKWVEIEIPLQEIYISDLETYYNKLILGTSKGIYIMNKK